MVAGWKWVPSPCVGCRHTNVNKIIIIQARHSHTTGSPACMLINIYFPHTSQDGGLAQSETLSVLALPLATMRSLASPTQCQRNHVYTFCSHTSQDSGLAQSETLSAFSLPSATMRSLAALVLCQWVKAGKERRSADGSEAAAAASPQVRVCVCVCVCLCVAWAEWGYL